MALVLMCGQPCSGKSTAAQCLSGALQSQSFNVRVINESSLHIERNQGYADMPSEKNLRGVLRSEVDRSVSKDSIIIVDSLNNIKGYRYELWCLARAAGTRYCVLYCDVEESYCKRWNNARREKGESAYSDKIFDDLVRRFEKPDRRNRWDSPLFELKPAEGALTLLLSDRLSALLVSTLHLLISGDNCIHCLETLLRWLPNFPEQTNELSSAILEALSFLTKKIDSKSRDVHLLQPTIATQSVRASETNSLYELDRATQDVINILVDAQAQGYGGVLNGINLGEGLPTINIQRTVGLPELRRLRRTFVRLTGQTSLSGPPPPIDAQSAKRMFADYLNQELGTT